MILYRRHYNACNNVLGGWMRTSGNPYLGGYSFMPDFTNYCFYDLDGRVIVNKKFDRGHWFVHRKIGYSVQYNRNDEILTIYDDVDAFIQQRNLQIHTKTLNIIRKFELLSKL